MGAKLLREYQDKNQMLRPGKPFAAPWIVLNGVSSWNMQFYSEVLLGAFCSWYSGDTLPKPCRLDADNANSVTYRKIGHCFDKTVGSGEPPLVMGHIA